MIDYMIMEAVAIKARHADERERKEAEDRAAREEFKRKAAEALADFK